MNKVQNNNLFEIEIFCNDINVFTVTFDQFNVPSLNKTINLTINLIIVCLVFSPHFFTICL